MNSIQKMEALENTQAQIRGPILLALSAYMAKCDTSQYDMHVSDFTKNVKIKGPSELCIYKELDVVKKLFQHRGGYWRSYYHMNRTYAHACSKYESHFEKMEDWEICRNYSHRLIELFNYSEKMQSLLFKNKKKLINHILDIENNKKALKQKGESHHASF